MKNKAFFLLLIFFIAPVFFSQIKFKEINSFTGHSSEIKCLAISTDNKIIASGSADKTIKLWNAETGKLLSTFSGSAGTIHGLTFSPDNKKLISTGEDQVIRILDIESGNEINKLTGHTSAITSIAISPDGKYLISGSMDKTLKTWELSTGKILNSLVVNSPVLCVSFSNSTVAACGTIDDRIIIYDCGKNSVQKTFNSNSASSVNAISFAGNGNLIIGGYGNNTIKIWDVSQGLIIKNLKDHWGSINSVSSNANIPLFISGSNDKTICVWSISDFSNLQTLKGHDNIVNAVLLSNDGKTIYAAGKDNSIIVFQTSGTNDLALQQNGNRNLNPKAPVITILEPKVSRGLKLSSVEKTITVKGKVEDDKGVYEVLVNDVEAQLSSNGEFSAEIKLVAGENTITVKAVDTDNFSTQETFTILRESGTIESTTNTNSPKIGTGGKYFAILIGVEQYADKNINTLANPVKDAKSMKDILTSEYLFEEGDVVFLKNPTRVDLLGAFEKMKKKISSEDNLLIFYAGHGYWDPEISQGYWLPSDAFKDNRANWISNADIRDNIRGIKSKHTLLISDACFSGGIFRTRAAFNNAPPSIQEVYKMTSRKGMTSGTLTEVADESVFLKYLIKRLKENSEKFFTAEELFRSLKTAVINNSKQVPQYGEIQDAGDEGGDFIFVKRK